MASRPPIASPRDQLDLIIGVSRMQSSIRLERSTMKSSRSTQSQHRGHSDADIDPIEGPVEGRVEGRPVRHLDLIIQYLQSSF